MRFVKVIPILLFLAVSISACRALNQTVKESTRLSAISSFTAINLSEDMSVLSTHNDEILLLFFAYDKKDNQWHPLQALSRYFVLDSSKMTHYFDPPLVIRPDTMQDNDVQMLIIEMDEDNTEVIEGNVMRLIESKGLEGLRNEDELRLAIGDNDLLISYSLPFTFISTESKIQLDGRQGLDAFAYQIELKGQ